MGPLGAAGGPPAAPPRPLPGQKVVIVASFPGDARDLQGAHGLADHEVLIATPSLHPRLEGLNGRYITRIYDVRRPGDGGPWSDRLDHSIDRLTTLYGVPYEVVVR